MGKIGIDEPPMRKHHNYISLFVDLADNKLIHVAKGKGSDTVADFAQQLPQHNATAQQVKEVSCDISNGILEGVKLNNTSCQSES